MSRGSPLAITDARGRVLGRVVGVDAPIAEGGPVDPFRARPPGVGEGEDGETVPGTDVEVLPVNLLEEREGLGVVDERRVRELRWNGIPAWRLSRS
jgi:hypothetical protein